MIKKRDIFLSIALFLIAFIVRMMTYNSIFVGNNVRFLEFDPFYHMRRAVSFALNFPHIWRFDTYLDFPNGNAVGWPPLYDWTIALISNVLGLGHPSKYLIETVGVYFPVLLGSLSVIVIYFLSKEIFRNSGVDDKKIDDKKIDEKKKIDDKKIDKNKLYDYKKIKADKKRKKVEIEKKEKEKEKESYKNYDISWQIGLISGLLLAILPAFLQVSFLGFVDHHVAEVLISLTVYLFLLKALRSDVVKEKVIFVSIVIIMLLVALLTIPDAPIFIGIILLYIVTQTIIDKNYRYLFAIIGTLLIFYLVTYLLFRSTYDYLMGGISFLFREGPVLQQIQETQPLFFTYQGIFTLEPSWYAFNTALYIAIIGMILFAIWLIKNNGLDRTKVFFLVWTLIVLVLNLFQTRFIYLLAVNIVILCSYLIADLLNSNKAHVKILGIILLTAILVPSIQTDITMATHPLMLSNDWFNSLEWLKQNTPDPGNWLTPSKDQTPNYGVMTWWDYGNYVLYLSQRPVIANNFQLGIDDSANFFASENETDANIIMNKRKAKYVIVDYRLGLNVYNYENKVYIRGSWAALAIILGKDLGYYLDRNHMPNDKYLNTMYARLYLFDGKGLNDYKLIYKSDTKYPDLFNRPIEEIKIFEYTGQ